LAGGRDNSHVVRFALSIPSDVYLSYYAGTARAVVVKSFDGRNIQFPAGVVQQFVTRDGIQGVFEMDFDANNKFVSIRRAAK
jgi:hypothetical protein